MAAGLFSESKRCLPSKLSFCSKNPCPHTFRKWCSQIPESLFNFTGIRKSHSYSIDLTQSVENEYLCTLIAKEFGLPVPHCFIMQVNKVKALAVERFDRRYATDRSWIMRLPQEDFCQVLNVPSARKYESHGGPGIVGVIPPKIRGAHK
ncbi:HipA domain-containing protein [Aeromonas rivipollensis]|uniref:HipA domain-containing protein n=1 Tax=Aeromonas rivipollensis TaxID=948519 RepID=UPI003CFD3A61